MTVVPLPDVPCVRVNLVYADNAGNKLGNRFFFRYTGGPPVSADLSTIAAAIGAAWETNLAPLTSTDIGLTLVDVLDIATDAGASGSSATGWDGSRSGTGLPIQSTANIKFNIARRYRGGKPKIYWPAGVVGDLENQAQWATDFINDVQTGTAAFFAAVSALTEASISMGGHVNLSYYKGFVNVTNSSGRERAAPTYRATALSDLITGYAYDLVIGS